MPDIPRQIFAYSGVLKPTPGDQDSEALLDYALTLAETEAEAGAETETETEAGAGSRAGRRKRLCYLPTAIGDLREAVDFYTTAMRERAGIEFSVLRLFTQPSVPDVRAHLLSQDVIWVEGGSVVNLMAVWRAHGLAAIMRECWQAGVVLTGLSAGSMCWHLGGPTDSFGDALAPFTDGLGLVPFSNGVHDDLDDQPRRSVYRELVAAGQLPAGYATEDGVGLHYLGTGLHEAISILPGKHAWRVDPDGAGGYTERAIVPRQV